MTNEEKKYLVKKKVSYEQQIDGNDKCIVLQTIAIGFILASLSIGNASNIDIFNNIIKLAQYIILTHCGTCLINNILDTIRLKDRIEDIDTEIELDKVRSM